MNKIIHTFKGRFYGMWYEVDGKFVYIAHRKPSEVFQQKMAWCIDKMTLQEASDRGCEMIGVVTKVNGKKHIYLTWLEDFTKSPFSFERFGDTRQRGLPMSRFRVNPGHHGEIIAAAMRLR